MYRPQPNLKSTDLLCPYSTRFRSKIGMDHFTLERPGAYDRDLDHQVVEAFGLDARQHRHLRPALDLEDAQRIGLLYHAIDGGIIILQVGHADRKSTRLNSSH